MQGGICRVIVSSKTRPPRSVSKFFIYLLVVRIPMSAESPQAPFSLIR